MFNKANTFAILISVIFLTANFITSHLDSQTKIVFCDVGQGDGIYIRIKNQIDLVIDAGPDKKILACLGRHMPYYDRKIEYAIGTHPQKDHVYGFLYLLDHYKMENYIMTRRENNAKFFTQLIKKLRIKKVNIVFATAQNTINILGDTIEIYWPDEDYLANNSSKVDENYFSIISLFTEDDFRLLLTADSPPTILETVGKRYNLYLHHVDILKVPHHGSKNGLNEFFLKLADPTISVISVGKNNSYGHPSKIILDMLKASKTKVRRTDLEGDIVFKIQSSNIK